MDEYGSTYIYGVCMLSKDRTMSCPVCAPMHRTPSVFPLACLPTLLLPQLPTNASGSVVGSSPVSHGIVVRHTLSSVHKQASSARALWAGMT